METSSIVKEILGAVPVGEYYLYTDMGVVLGGIERVGRAGISMNGKSLALGDSGMGEEARRGALEYIVEMVKRDRGTQLYLDYLANAATGLSADVELEDGGRYDIDVDAQEGEGLLCVQRLVLHAGENVRADVVLHVASASTLLLQTKINAGAGAVLRIVVVQDGEDKQILTRTTIDQEAGSDVDITYVNFDPKLARNEVKCGMHGEGSKLKLNGLYVVGGDHRVDNETLVEHHVGRTTSGQLFKGIAHGSGRMAFGGLILVKPDAQKTSAEQTNRHLLASREARGYSKPQLEIYADDVKCSHGATTGQIDPGQLFYMQQRGIDEGTARRLLAAAFVGEVVDAIPFPEIQKRLRERLTGETEVI